MNFSEAVTEAYGVDFTPYTVQSDDSSQTSWHMYPGSIPLPGATDGDSAKAAALDYFKNDSRDVPIGTWVPVAGEYPAFKILAVTPAQ